MNLEQLEQLEQLELELELEFEVWAQKYAQLILLKTQLGQGEILENFEDIETKSRDTILTKLGPQLIQEIVKSFTGIKTGKKRQITTIDSRESVNYK